MTRHMLNYFVLGFSLLSLASCTSMNEAGEPPHYFGNAVEQNIAAQIVNPDAPEENTAPEHVGARIAVGQARYVIDKVDHPKEVRTSDVGGGE